VRPRRGRRRGRLGPGHVRRARAVAGLAADAQLAPPAGEAVRLRVVAELEVGDVALHTHVVGRLQVAGPVERVAGLQRFVGEQVEPALAPRLRGARVPGPGKRAQAAALCLDQILLQRVDAEGVGQGEHGLLAVGAAHDRFIALAGATKHGTLAAVLELHPQLGQHGHGCGRLHGAGVIRRLPGQRLGFVAGRATRRAHERRCRALGRGLPARGDRPAAAPDQEPDPRRQDGQAACKGPHGLSIRAVRRCHYPVSLIGERSRQDTATR
jgi:hypothetical protein